MVAGYLASLAFCLLVSYSSIFIHKTNQAINPLLSVFVTFLICTIFFNLINLHTLKKLYQKLPGDKKNFIIINLFTAVNWIATFAALKYIDAVLYISLFMGLMPIATYIVQRIQENKKIALRSLITYLIIALILALIALVYKNSLLPTETVNFNKGLILTILSVICSATYLVYSKQLQINLQLTTSQIVAVRFYFLVIYSGIICLNNNYWPQINTIHFSNFIFLALISSILPLYALQRSITLIGPQKTAFIQPFTSIFTYLLLYFSNYPLPKALFPLLIILTVALLYNAGLLRRFKTPINQQERIL